MTDMLTTMAGVPARCHQCIYAEKQDQNTRAAPHPDKARDLAEPARGGAHGEQHRQRAQTEGEHQRGALYGVTRSQRPGERRIHQPARQPAPHQPERECLERVIHRQKPPAQGFDAHPEFSAETFQRREARPPAGEVKPERDHETTGDDFRDEPRLFRWRDAQYLRAQEPDEGASDGVARDASDVVGGEIREKPDGRAADVIVQSECECAHDAAAHAEAMRRTQQADEERRDESDFRWHEMSGRISILVGCVPRTKGFV